MKKMEFLLFLTLLLLSTPSRSMPEISLRVSHVQFSTGDQVVAQIDIEKLESGHAIGAFDISINYDAARLFLSSIQFGNQLDLLGLGSVRNTY